MLQWLHVKQQQHQSLHKRVRYNISEGKQLLDDPLTEEVCRVVDHLAGVVLDAEGASYITVARNKQPETKYI